MGSILEERAARETVPTLEFMPNGTLLFRNAHNLSQQLRDKVEEFYPSGCCNLYVSQPNVLCRQHSDPYDLNVVQVHGEKTWDLAGEKFTLKAGDTKLIPANTVHITKSGPYGSIHLTVRRRIEP